MAVGFLWNHFRLGCQNKREWHGQKQTKFGRQEAKLISLLMMKVRTKKKYDMKRNVYPYIFQSPNSRCKRFRLASVLLLIKEHLFFFVIKLTWGVRILKRQWTDLKCCLNRWFQSSNIARVLFEAVPKIGHFVDASIPRAKNRMFLGSKFPRRL